MANNCDELEGIHGRLGKAVASAENGMQAAIRQAGELGDGYPRQPRSNAFMDAPESQAGNRGDRRRS